MPPLRGAALTRVAAWQLESGQVKEAAQAAGLAAGNEVAALVQAFSTPLDDADFSRRVAQLYPGPANQERRTVAEGYRLLFRRQWDRALPVWKALADNPNEQTARAVYAWILLRNGRKPEAAKYAATTPVWHPNQNDVFTGIWFPRLLAVRASTGPDAERAARVYKSIGGE